MNTCVDQAESILKLPAMDITGEEIAPTNYDIQAKNISFSYDKKQIIGDITLEIPQKRLQRLSVHRVEVKLHSAIFFHVSGMWMPGRSHWAVMMCGSTVWTA